MFGFVAHQSPAHAESNFAEKRKSKSGLLVDD